MSQRFEAGPHKQEKVLPPGVSIDESGAKHNPLMIHDSYYPIPRPDDTDIANELVGLVEEARGAEYQGDFQINDVQLGADSKPVRIIDGKKVEFEYEPAQRDKERYRLAIQENGFQRILPDALVKKRKIMSRKDISSLKSIILGDAAKDFELSSSDWLYMQEGFPRLFCSQFLEEFEANNAEHLREVATFINEHSLMKTQCTPIDALYILIKPVYAYQSQIDVHDATDFMLVVHDWFMLKSVLENNDFSRAKSRISF